MKKLALTIVCALAVTGAAFGQANLVSFAPGRTTITFETNAAAYSPLFGGGAANGSVAALGTPSAGFNYYFTLLYQSQSGYQALATDQNVWDGTWLDTGLTATNSNSFVGQGAIASVGVGATTVPWNNPTTNSIVLVGWSADLGTTWVGVSNILAALSNGNNTPLATKLAGQQGFFGESAFGYLTPAVSPASGAAIFATSATGNGLPISGLLTPLYLLPVPEPATMALVGLGGLSLMLFRRQRK
jgi:hypothetical protein